MSQLHPSIDLYGAQTGNCLRVAIALEEAQLRYNVIKLDLKKKEHQQPEFLALNPRGKVPIIVDRRHDGAPLLLTQSNAILFHIAESAPGSLLPETNAQLRAIFFERFFYFLTDVIAVSHAAFRLRLGDHKSASEELHQSAINAICETERFLNDSEFIAGDTFTLADIAALTITSSVEHQIKWNLVPQLDRWYKAVIARPAVSRGLKAFS